MSTRSHRIALVMHLFLLASAVAIGSDTAARAQATDDAQPNTAQPARLSHNDGTAEGKRSIAGAAEWVSFTLAREGDKVAAIRIHGSRYGLPQPPKEDFTIYILNQDLSKTIAKKTAPYGRFQRGAEKWVEIKFAEPVEVPQEFWVGVEFRPEKTKGVYVSIDKSTDGSHSRVGAPGQALRDAKIGGDWMIEVVLAK